MFVGFKKLVVIVTVDLVPATVPRLQVLFLVLMFLREVVLYARCR